MGLFGTMRQIDKHMNDGDIDYSKYSQKELEEALDGINSKLYPRNYENIYAALSKFPECNIQSHKLSKINKSYNLFLTNFFVGLATLPLLVVIEYFEKSIGNTLLWWAPLFLILCAMNLNDLLLLLRDKESRLAWISIAVSSISIGFLRMLQNDIVFFISMIIWISIFITCWIIINTRYRILLNASKQ